ncbi:MAG: HD-GYP domain-containing protein [Gallionellaceae bacterium]|nr:HD-GYP domain-containing protein [Gallionellaceae bacterium]
MLKRIHIKQLRLGMYIHELCGSWMDHPFWRDTFLLDNPKDLQTILSTGIHEVWIDAAKGLDVEDGATEEMVAAEVEATLEHANTASKIVPRANLAQEAARAAKVCSQARRTITSLFQEARMGKALQAEALLPIVDEIAASVMRHSGALISLVRLKDKDHYTYMHSVAVSALMVSLARQLMLDDVQVRQAGMAGLLHDIGKMAVPLEILNKPGKLTDAEFEVMKGHPAAGRKMLLESSGIDDVVLDVCLQHHERLAGNGYPDYLRDEQISMYAKMGTVCDVYDAITSSRPYKSGWEPADAIRKMAEWSKGTFDQRIFEAFVRNVGIYPIGTLVRLQSGHLAVVTEQTEKSLLVPMVKVFFSIKSNARIAPEVLDLSKPGCKDKIVSHENPAKWDIRDIHELWSGMPAIIW